MKILLTSFLFTIYGLTLFSQEKINFLLKVNEKDTFFYEESYKAETFQNINGTINKVSNQINSNYFYTVDRISNDSIVEMKLKFQKIKINTKSHNQEININTDSINSISNEAEAFYLAVVKQYFIFPIDQKYRVKNSFVYNYRIKQIIDSIGIEPDRKKSYNTFIEYNRPEVKFGIIKPQSSLIVKDSVYLSNDSIDIDIFRFKNIVQHCDCSANNKFFVEINSDVYTDKKEPNGINGLFIFYETSGKSKINYSVYKNSGVISTYKMNFNVKGKVIIKYSKTGLPAYIWPIEIQVENNYKLIDNHY